MKYMKKTEDKRLVLLDAILRCADKSDYNNQYFYKDDVIKKLDVCEHTFNIMLKQLGDRYCRMVDIFEVRSRYAINVIKCFELRDQIIQADIKEKRHHEDIRIKLLSTLIGTFLVILIGQFIM
jgi:hypothetical protein